MSTGSRLMYNRRFGYTLITFCLVLLQCSKLSEGRGIPPRTRSNSKSFRFPNSVEDRGDTFQESATFFLGTRTESHDQKSQSDHDDHLARHSVISLDSVPIKPAVPLSPRNEVKNEQPNTTSVEETLSSEIIDGDLDISTNDNNMNSDDYEKNGQREDEILRELLCPPIPRTTRAVGSNASTNENSRKTGTIVSSTDSKKVRYDLRAGKCAEVGKKEHCGANMIFVAEIDSAAYGYCECDFENKILRREEKQAALFSRTPLVYHLSSNSCYRLYEQAYCNDNEWLVLSRAAKGPICEQRKCPTRQDEVELTSDRPLESRRRSSKLLTPTFWTNNSAEKAKTRNSSENGIVRGGGESIWVPLNGSGPCVQLFRNNSQYCEEGEQVVFAVGHIVPTCGILGRGIEGRAIVRNACPPGSYYSIIGRCQPDWDF